MIKSRYDIYINSACTGILHAADCVLIENEAVLTDFGFRYRPEYLARSDAFPLDPVQLPLKQGEMAFSCQGGLPGLIDDYLPDAWGRRILSQLALYRDQKQLNANSVIDSLAMIGHSRIGGISIVLKGGKPFFESGTSITELQKAEYAAQQIDSLDYKDVSLDEMSLLYLANTGTGVGGARPKALVHDEKTAFVAKFNRLNHDPYNNARVELACLTMAERAGIRTSKGKVASGINGREVLLIERFDVNSDQSRNHLISINSLLKEPSSQRDSGRAFRYDDICDLLRDYSIKLEEDLTQLLMQMLFNRSINNTDDHERNFSLIHTEAGYSLAPAYDMVPSVVRGAYPAAGFQYQPAPPTPIEAMNVGQIFGLPKAVVNNCAEAVQSIISCWPEIAYEVGVEDEQAVQIESLFHR